MAVVHGARARAGAGYGDANEAGVELHRSYCPAIESAKRHAGVELVAVGSDVDLRGNTRTGSILLSEMTVAGN